MEYYQEEVEVMPYNQYSPDQYESSPMPFYLFGLSAIMGLVILIFLQHKTIEILRKMSKSTQSAQNNPPTPSGLAD